MARIPERRARKEYWESPVLGILDAMTMGAVASSSPGLVRRHRGKLLAIGALLAVSLVGFAYTTLVLKFSYSDGERVGYVQKMSRKGWICRTWEGELAVTPVPGTPPEIWAFTVPDPAVAAQIQTVEGRRVALHYSQKKGIPSSCFGDTQYFVTGARPVGN
jgi:hypothetical protein